MEHNRLKPIDDLKYNNYTLIAVPLMYMDAWISYTMQEANLNILNTVVGYLQHKVFFITNCVVCAMWLYRL